MSMSLLQRGAVVMLRDGRSGWKRGLIDVSVLFTQCSL